VQRLDGKGSHHWNSTATTVLPQTSKRMPKNEQPSWFNKLRTWGISFPTNKVLLNWKRPIQASLD
jgi:hypothetical protein